MASSGKYPRKVSVKFKKLEVRDAAVDSKRRVITEVIFWSPVSRLFFVRGPILSYRF